MQTTSMTMSQFKNSYKNIYTTKQRNITKHSETQSYDSMPQYNLETTSMQHALDEQ